MSGKPSAIGYLRTDISRDNQRWDEARMRSAAADCGYNLRKTMAVSSESEASLQALVGMVERVGASAVVTPALNHFARREFPADLTVGILAADSGQIYDPTTGSVLRRSAGDHR
ncbi:hypothetical protein [Nocardia sp. NPDC050435]|uniref:hypothetical protein n=1 Tax=Nocardia sp. NPDC050435 TaxID=3155040 RepID=UPI0033FD8DF8